MEPLILEVIHMFLTLLFTLVLANVSIPTSTTLRHFQPLWALLWRLTLEGIQELKKADKDVDEAELEGLTRPSKQQEVEVQK